MAWSLTLIGGCSQTNVASTADAADAATADVSEDRSVAEETSAVPEIGGFEIGPPFDAPPWEAPPPPVIACHGDARVDGGEVDATVDGAGGADAASIDPECPLPPSVCGDGHTLVYYEGGACIGGVCSFTTKTQNCYAPCTHGACQPGPTL